jgi:hypothetical protein
MSKVKSDPIKPVKVTKDFVLAKCNYFVDVQLWPIHSEMDPERWLNNFKPEEMDHAVQLLYSFLYYSEKLSDEMFVAAFQGLSRELMSRSQSLLTLRVDWRTFVDSVIITYVTGEVPNVTDSGYTFARRARQLLSVPEERIMSPEKALLQLYNYGPQPVVFVDDFVGSGDQFIKTWERPVSIASSVTASFKKLASMRGSQFFYCPLICTQTGFDRLERECPNVQVSPAHILSNRYNAFASNSLIWPPELLPTASDFIYEASTRAGIHGISWRGYNDLGLAIAFQVGHSVPDATLPIIYWNENGWNPLVERA